MFVNGGCMILFAGIVLTLLWVILIFVVASVIVLVVFQIAMIVYMRQMMQNTGGWHGF